MFNVESDGKTNLTYVHDYGVDIHQEFPKDRRGDRMFFYQQISGLDRNKAEGYLENGNVELYSKIYAKSIPIPCGFQFNI